MKHIDEPQSFQRVFLRPDIVARGLTVLAPIRLTLLAGAQITGAETIPFNKDTL